MYLLLKRAEMDEFKRLYTKTCLPSEWQQKIHTEGNFTWARRISTGAWEVTELPHLRTVCTGNGGDCLVLNFTLLLPTMFFWRPWILHDIKHVFSQPLSSTLNSCISKEWSAKWLVPFLKLDSYDKWEVKTTGASLPRNHLLFHV